MSSFNIKFNAHAEIVQTVTILEEGLSVEKLVEGLNSGEFMTTLQYEETEPVDVLDKTVVRIDGDGEFIAVAKIKDQCVYDSVYTGFSTNTLLTPTP